MKKTSINKYTKEFCNGTVVVESGSLASDVIPDRLSGVFTTDVVTIDWIYRYDTDEFFNKTRYSINKDNTYVINKIEENVRSIAAEILIDNGINLVAVKQAIIDTKAAQKAAQLALESVEEEITEE